MKKKCKRLVSMIASLATVATVNVAILSNGASKVAASGSDPMKTKTIVFDYSILKNGCNSTCGVVNSAIVYYGHYTNGTNNPIGWRVISYDGNGAVTHRDATYNAVTLYSEGKLFDCQFNEDINDKNVYKNSTLMKNVHQFTNDALTSGERSAILFRDFGVSPYDERGLSDGTSGDPVWDQLLWPLTTHDAYRLDKGLMSRNRNTVLISPGKPEDTSGINIPGTRIACIQKISDSEWEVNNDGEAVDHNFDVRLAFSLKFKNIAMLTAAFDDKDSGPVGVDSLKQVHDYEISGSPSWKVTLKDKGRSAFAAERVGDGYVEQGKAVSIKYENARKGSNEFVSMILSSAADPETPLYYGRIAQDSENGTVDVNIPKNLKGDYILKIYSEQYNGRLNTDYASEFKTISIKVAEAAEVADAPAAVENLIYNGQEQTLITEGKAVNGTMMYKLGADGTYSEDLPKAKNAGAYEVYYKAAAVAGTEFVDGQENKIDVTISKAPATVIPDNFSKVIGSKDPELTATIRGLADGDTADMISYTLTRVAGEDEGIYQINSDGKRDQGNYEVGFGTGSLTITEGEIFYTATSNSNGSYTIESGKDVVITVKRNVNDEKTFDLYKGSSMDDKEITKEQGIATKGSLILTLQSSYLDTLSEGQHKVKINFADGAAELTINVGKVKGETIPKEDKDDPEKIAPKEDEKSKERDVPKTGDTSKDKTGPAIFMLAVSGAAVAVVIVKTVKKRHE